MITIINYGLGNISAFSNMYKRLGIPARVATNVAELRGTTKIVLPGVGAFDRAMHLLGTSGMREPLDDLVLAQKVPVVGICVGMQILAQFSDEGSARGLGWIPGRVRHFGSDPSSAALPMPHMGWNDVEPAAADGLFHGMNGDARFYFLHSFYFECENASDVVATAQYGLSFACAVRRENVYGVQFHPEKSHHWGAAMLKNFAEI